MKDLPMMKKFLKQVNKDGLTELTPLSRGDKTHVDPKEAARIVKAAESKVVVSRTSSSRGS